VSSGQGQPGSLSTPPNTLSWGYIGIAPPWQQPPTYAIYAEVTKDGRKMLLKLGKAGDNVAKLLKPHVGSQVTIYVTQLGVAWTSTLAERRRWGYLYVRIPSRLKALFEPIWKVGYPIPVIISIPPIPTNLKDRLRSQGGDAPASLGSNNRGASAGLGGQAPQSGQEG